MHDKILNLPISASANVHRSVLEYWKKNVVSKKYGKDMKDTWKDAKDMRSTKDTKDAELRRSVGEDGYSKEWTNIHTTEEMTKGDEEKMKKMKNGNLGIIARRY